MPVMFMSHSGSFELALPQRYSRCYSLRNSDNLTGPWPFFDTFLPSPAMLLDVSLESEECLRLLL